jgi:type VI secretion system protein ImpF
MPKSPSGQQPLVPSLLDRLMDDAPDLRAETPRSSAQLLRELKQSVRRDLENLLNTRWRCVEWPESLAEIEDSLVNYGIPDFTATHFDAAQDPDILLRAIEDCIRRFEPRLRDVRLQAIEGAADGNRTFRFRIDGVLCVEPLEDPVRYDSSLEPTTGNVRVEGAGR